MTALLYPNIRNQRSLDCVLQTCRQLIELGFEVCVDEAAQPALSDAPSIRFGAFDTLAADCDVIIAIGGDGSILHSSKAASQYNVPLLGINMGHLGFMASLEPDQLDQLSKLRDGNYQCIRRMMLDVQVSGKCYTALNDVVLQKEMTGKLPDYTVKSNDIPVTTIRADGIVFSTPTGSTAYSLSAGGPIIEPDLECIEFTQICAHSLFARSMLFSASKRISVVFHSADSKDVMVSIDGEDPLLIPMGEEIIVQKSQRYVDLIDISGDSFYAAINNKLMKPMK